MNTPTMDLIHKHASVRYYKRDPLPASIIETIILAAQCASTSSNMQTYSVIAVTEESKREKLSALCAGQKFIAEAPVFLVWVADLARLDRVCELRGFTQVTEHVESFLVPVVDCAIASQPAALAAESLGLGICYVGSIRNNPQEVIDLLNLPLHTFPIVGMTLGWPTKEPLLKPRLPLSAILHRETYQSDQDTALMDYDRTMASTGIYQNRQVPTPGQPNTVNNYGWLEHSACRAARVVRAEMREVLEKQGFPLK
jgi:nitroreductase